MQITIPLNYQSLILPDQEWLRFLGSFFQGTLLNVPVEEGIVNFSRISPDDLRRCPPRPTDRIPVFSRDFRLRKPEILLLTAARRVCNGFFPNILVQHGRPTHFEQPREVMHMK